MAGDIVYLNGQLVERAAALVSAFDRGMLYGDGLFETTRIIAGRGLFLGRHLDRLASSCAELGFGVPIDRDAIASGAAATIEANAVGEGYLRITVTRGTHAGRLTALECDAPTVLIEARAMVLSPLDAVPPITLVRSPWRRDEGSPVVRHKSTSYQVNVLALADGKGRGADDVYFLNSRGDLTEGAVSNLFWVRGGTVYTAGVECGLLPGVTRQVVLDICAREGIPAEAGSYPESALLEADEAFCTNSLRGLMPVAAVLAVPEAAGYGSDTVAKLQRDYAADAVKDAS